ncbi:MAG: copper amine oxidase N-terminal domain-containing protein, partial [Clostridia bacterium]|nr:copper amine oxidase N-terminal domain-containing protein [Clostridia bacterium]
DTSEGSTEKGENTENSKPDGEATGKPSAEEKEEPKEEIKEEPKEEQKEEPKEETKPSQSTGSGNGGNCCNHEDFISFIVPASSPTLVIEFPDGTKYNAVDQEKKNLASSEKSKDGNRIFWDVWIGSEYEYEDLKVTVYDENYNSRYDYTVYETNPFTESEIAEYEKAISNELRIEENPNQLIVELAINNKWMIINSRDLVEIDPGRDTTPVLVDGRTMLPIRAIVEVLGGKVGWEESTRCVHIEIFNKDIKFYIDSLDMTWNNIPAKMDVAPQIINERTMLPIRFVAEVLDHTTVEWNGQSASVTITYNY